MFPNLHPSHTELLISLASLVLPSAQRGRQHAADPLNDQAAGKRNSKKNLTETSLKLNPILLSFWVLLGVVLAQLCDTFGVEGFIDFRGAFVLTFLPISSSILAPFWVPKPLPEPPRREKVDPRF